jgi:hypothetical protein
LRIICSPISAFCASSALNSARGSTATSLGSRVFTQAERGFSSSIISPTYWPAVRTSRMNSLPFESMR